MKALTLRTAGRGPATAPSRRPRGVLRWSTVARWVAATIAAVVAIFPVWWMLNIVFTPAGQGVALKPRLWPTSLEAGFANIQSVVADPVFVHSFANSMVYSTVQVVGVLAVTSMAAYEFAHRPGFGRRALFAVCLIGLMVPPAITLLPTQRLIVALGWLNSIPGIVVPSVASSFALFILTEYMRAVPRELIEAARVDGASNVMVYARIAMPLCRNGLLAVGILTFVEAWASYLWPLVVAIDPGSYPVSVEVAGYFSRDAQTTINQVMAASLVSIAPIVIVYVVLQRWIVDAVARVGIHG